MKGEQDMYEILQGIFVGSQADYIDLALEGEKLWQVVHACKEPYHRQAVGYTGRGAPADSPEYLVARRGNHMMLNLVDVDNVEFIRPEIIDAALSHIREGVKNDLPVIIHCNQGHSRSAVIGLLYLASIGIYKDMTFEQAETEFLKVYPDYSPAKGMRDYAKLHWAKYCAQRGAKWGSKL